MQNIEIVIGNTKPDSKSIMDELEAMTFGGVVAKKKSKDKTEKKAKKKSKKKKSLDFSLDIPGVEEGDDASSLLDIDLEKLIEGSFDEDGNPISDSIVDEQKNGYKKRRADKNPYKKEFAEEMTLLYDLYDNVSNIAKDLEKQVKAISTSKTRGTTKSQAEMIANLLSAKSNQLQILKELSSVKKTTMDLKLKEEARKSKDQVDTNIGIAGSNYIQQILNAGRNNVMQSLRGTTKPGFLVDSYVEEGEYEEDVEGTFLEYHGNTPGYSDNENFQMNQFLLERIEEEGYNGRTEDGDKLIKYEKQGVEVCIQRDIATDEYEFVAIDKHGNIVHDYPLPQNPGKIKFNGPNATDRYGQSFKVIEYDSMNSY